MTRPQSLWDRQSYDRMMQRALFYGDMQAFLDVGPPHLLSVGDVLEVAYRLDIAITRRHWPTPKQRDEIVNELRRCLRLGVYW